MNDSSSDSGEPHASPGAARSAAALGQSGAASAEVDVAVAEPAVQGFVVVPYRIVFDVHNVVQWVRYGLPLLWHQWSDLTDASRISLSRRREVLRYRWDHLFTSMSMPGHAQAVRWWLARLMAGDDWLWDSAFVADHAGVEIAGHRPLPQGVDALRRPVREFLYPEGFVDLLRDYPDLASDEHDHVYVPPTTAYHLRLRSLRPGRPGWIAMTGDAWNREAHQPRSPELAAIRAAQSGQPPASAIPIIWQHIRLHQFRFGDGFVSLSFRLARSPIAEEAGAADVLAHNVKRLWAWMEHPERVQFGFTAEGGGFAATPGPASAPLPWGPPPALGLGTLVRHLLTPAKLYVDKPETEQWAFVWEEHAKSLRDRHRIEFPLANQIPLLLLPTGTLPSGEGDASRVLVDATLLWPDKALQVDTYNDLRVRSLALLRHFETRTSAPDMTNDGEATAMLDVPGGPNTDGHADAATGDESNSETAGSDDANGNGAAGHSDADGSDATSADAPPWRAPERETAETLPSAEAASIEESRGRHALSVFMLALLRRVKLAQVGDLLAMPRGKSGLNTAQDLQSINFELSVARDRFLGGPPVVGGRLAALWNDLEERWETADTEARLTGIVDSYRDNFFRDRSLRLIARVTSTFWFLFRWIILSLLVLQFLVIAVTGLILGVAAVLTLSVFVTVIVVVVKLLQREVGSPGEDAGATRLLDDDLTRRRKKRTRWIYGIAIGEAVVLALLLVLWPDLRELMLPYLKRFLLAGAAVIGIGVAVFFGVWRTREKQRKVLAALKREMFPVLGLAFVGLVLFALLIWAWAFLDRVGLDRLRFPRFWGSVYEAPAVPGETQREPAGDDDDDDDDDGDDS